MPVERLLVLGLDGLEPSLVQRLSAEGRLPHMTRLRNEGRWGPLRSTLPYATFPAWTTFMTGVNPGQHGIFDFAAAEPGSYGLRFVSGASRRRPILPAMAAAAGMATACVGFPGTYPPEPLPGGVMIGGFDSPVAVSADASFVHPPELAAEIEGRFGRWVFADFAETRTWLPGWHRRAARKLMTGLRRRRAISTWLLNQRRWDLFMVHFGESDTAAHHFWAFHDPDSPRRPASFDPDLAGVLEEVYVELDASVGALVEGVGPDARVVVASDHGFGGSSDKVLHLNRYLAERGLLHFDEGPSLTGAAFGAAVKAGLALTPGRVQERLWRLAGDWAGRAEARRRYGGVDFSHTRAWSDELSYNPTVRLNLAATRPAGTVAADAVEPTIAEVMRALDELVDPWSGQPVVKEAWRAEELYEGPAVGQSPELVLDLALDGDYSYNLLTSSGPGPIWRRLSEDERLGAKAAGMNGTHRRDGFWLLWGPGVTPRRKRAAMADMAPTMLSALGLEAPAWMEGRPHLRTGPEAPLPDALPQRAPESGYSAAQQAIVEERLRRLGYF